MERIFGTVLVGQGQVVGERTPTSSKREYCHRSGGQQVGSRHGATGQTCDPDGRCRGLCPRGRPTLLRDLRQDLVECTRAVHRDRKETAAGSGGTEKPAHEPAARRRPAAGGSRHSGGGRLSMLSCSVGWWGSVDVRFCVRFSCFLDATGAGL